MKLQASSPTGTRSSVGRLTQPLLRNVRVFISSTFRDMHAEREELVKHVFPQLRDFCERRRVVLTEVDLRWGIPQEEVDAGKVLPICLAEVTNCHPFFVCLLGDRYGTVVESIPDELLESEPWLKEHSGKSITELEILHGALNRTDPPVHAFFYLRSPARAEPSPGVISGAEDVVSESKLSTLKRRILGSGLPVREYASPQAAGKLLLNDLEELFGRLFPEGTSPGPLEQETLAHDAFAESRSRIYVGLQYYFDRLDEYADGRQPPLIVTGGAGVGKSALLANWALRRSGHPARIPLSSTISDSIRRKVRRLVSPFATASAADAFLLTHFVGASAQSANWADMLRRIMETLRGRFDLSLNIPESKHLLPSAFANYLQAIATLGTVILVIDGIDQLADGEQLAELAWLPTDVPPNVRMIVTASDAGVVDHLRGRRWPVMEVKPLRIAEREAFITGYLEQYRKKLGPVLHRRIASANHGANPLYLRTILEELRLFGRRSEELPKHIEHLLTAESTEELFEKVLARLEDDYPLPVPKRGGLASDTMRLLWAARHGLSESELADLMGTSTGPLPGAVWSPFYLAVKESLLDRLGLLSFFHQDFRRAVEKRYLPGDEEKRAAHCQLANYFTRSGSTQRRTAELPWHLAAIGAWAELASLLARPDFLSAAWPAHQFEVKSYWSMVETQSPFMMVDAYAPIVSAPERYKDCVWAVCSLLSDAGHVPEALALSDYLERDARSAGDAATLQKSLSLRAVLLKKRGELNLALELLREQEQICRRLENWAAVASSLGNQGVILQEQGRPEAALSMHRQEEQICRRLQDIAGLSACLGNQGVILQENDSAGALKLLREQEKICRQLGDLAGLQKSFGNQGLVLWREGKTEEALKLLKLDEALCRRLGDPASLNVCLGNQALMLAALGDYDGALELYRQKEAICREIADVVGLARGLWQQAHLFAEKLRRPDFALPLAEEAGRVAAQNGLAEMTGEIEQYVVALRRQGGGRT
jgi:tetratricopeptide (TPR) repeat protein